MYLVDLFYTSFYIVTQNTNQIVVDFFYTSFRIVTQNTNEIFASNYFISFNQLMRYTSNSEQLLIFIFESEILFLTLWDIKGFSLLKL